jgi:FtsH-binding integral membrane protein
MQAKQEISVWFFIGVLLAIYGVLIVGATITSPPKEDVVFSQYHIGIWWGALLFVLGMFYSIAFRPKKD